MTAIPNQEPKDLVKKDDVIMSLHRMGMDEFAIAAAVREDVKLVKSRIRKFTTTTRFSNPEDTDLANAMRNLAWKAYEEALVTIQVGAPAERLGLLKTILGRTASMIGTETSTQFDDMRNEFDDMLSRIRSDDEDTIDVGPFESSTPTINFDDRD